MVRTGQRKLTNPAAGGDPSKGRAFRAGKLRHRVHLCCAATPQHDRTKFLPRIVRRVTDLTTGKRRTTPLTDNISRLRDAFSPTDVKMLTVGKSGGTMSPHTLLHVDGFGCDGAAAFSALDL